MRKLYKGATIQEYSQGYLDIYKGQDHHEGWNSFNLLREIRETDLPVPSSFATQVIELPLSEGNVSSFYIEELPKKVDTIAPEVTHISLSLANSKGTANGYR